MAAKIRKTTNHGETRWICDLRSIGGSRTFHETKKDAEDWAEQKTGEHRQYGDGAFQLSNAARAEFMKAADELKAIGATVWDAVRFYKEHHSAMQPKTFKDAIELFLDTKRSSGKNARYIRQLGYNLNGLKESLGLTKVHEVTADSIEKWLRNPAWKMETVRSKTVDIRTFFRFCVKRHFIVRDPAAVIEKVHITESPPGILSVPQVTRLMNTVRAHGPKMVPYFALAIFAGVRPEEIRRLDQSEIDVATGYVEIKAAKAKGGPKGGRKRRLVRLSDNCKAWLNLGGEIPPKNWRKRFDSLRQLAGFSTEEGQPGDRWPQDTMRHSYCSYALPIYGAEQTALWAGHSQDVLFSRYRDLVRREEAEQFWAIKPE